MISYDKIVEYWGEKEPDCKDWFEELCSIQDEIVPFIGAGLSKNVNGNAYPLWKEFLKEIGKKELLPVEDEELKELMSKNWYGKAAGFLEQKLGDVLFRDNVKKIFAESRLEGTVLPEKIALLTELFQGNIVTTNIDKTIEFAFKNIHNIMIPLVIPQIQSDMANKNISTNALCLIKIHGDVNEATSWVLTERQYDAVYGSKVGEDLPFVAFLKRLMMSRKILFIGCGLEKDRTYDVLNDIIQHNNNYKHFAFIEDPNNDESRIMKKRYLINSLNIYPIWFPSGCFESIELLLKQMTLYHRTKVDAWSVKKK